MQITYEEFITGIYAKYHYQPQSSRSFITTGKEKIEGITFCDIIHMMTDSQIILKKLSLNMARAFELMAQGYYCEEVARMLKISTRTVERYPDRMRGILKGIVGLYK